MLTEAGPLLDTTKRSETKVGGVDGWLASN